MEEILVGGLCTDGDTLNKQCKDVDCIHLTLDKEQ
jgi:hypothetical protein